LPNALLILFAPFLVFVARSWRGRLEGVFGCVVASFVGGAAVWVWHLANGTPVPDAAKLVVAVTVAAVFPLSLLAASLKRRCHLGEGPVGTHHFLADPNPDMAGWADVEDDYVWLLTQLVTRLDPLLPRAEGRAARATIRDLIDAVRSHPDYLYLARVGVSHRLMRGRLDPGHCYSYRPPTPGPDGRYGVLVFMHGHGMNYLMVLHALRPLCDRLGVVLVSPTFGYGNWEAPGGAEAIERALRFALAAFPTDPRRVIAMGFSQGGAGVSRIGAACAAELAGLVFVSATMEQEVLDSQAFAAGWRGKPVLVIQGERDHNVKPRTVTGAVETMQANGAKVTYHADPDAGHFLFFAQLDAVRAVVATWAVQAGLS
jgi:pimeloyl-ACP methyl ester carboxylesterase